MLSSLLLGAACTPSGHVPSEPEDGGPLVVLAGSGASSIYPLTARPWSGVFGFDMCVRDGETAYLDSVDYDFRAAPEVLPRAVVRVVPDGEMGTGTAYGPLEELRHGPRRLPGEFHELDRYELDVDCGRILPSRIVEVVIELTTEGAGAWLTEATIRYHEASGREFETPIPWAMIVCGSDIRPQDGKDYCEALPAKPPEPWGKVSPEGRPGGSPAASGTTGAPRSAGRARRRRPRPSAR